MSDLPKCELCGHPMPEGEEMFKFHGYTGPCPGPRTRPMGGVPEVIELHGEKWVRIDVVRKQEQRLTARLAEAEAERDVERRDRTAAEFELLATRDKLADAEAKIQRLLGSVRDYEVQLCTISKTMGNRDARHVSGDYEHTIAGLVQQEFDRLNKNVITKQAESSCPKCGSSKIDDGVHGGIRYECGSFQSCRIDSADPPVRFDQSLECARRMK